MQIEITRGNLGRWNIITQTVKCSGCWVNNMPVFFKGARHFQMVSMVTSLSLNLIIRKYFLKYLQHISHNHIKNKCKARRKEEFSTSYCYIFSSFYSVEEAYTQVE